MKKAVLFLCLSFIIFTISAFAQVRPVMREQRVQIKAPELKNLPDFFKVKYKGGLFGFNKKMHGTIRFDDINERLVFFGKDKKEKFSIPYRAILVVYPSQYKIQSGSGKVVGAVPIPGAGLLGSLVKKRKNYLVVKFKDPEVDAQGNINFLLDTGKMLRSAIHSLGQRAEMKRRGDSYIRGKGF